MGRAQPLPTSERGATFCDFLGLMVRVMLWNMWVALLLVFHSTLTTVVVSDISGVLGVFTSTLLS